jgi:hypothetical protein
MVNSGGWIQPTCGGTAGGGAVLRGRPRRSRVWTGPLARRNFILSKNSWW